MNIFDSLKKQAFDVVTDVMGYNATWLSESITHVAKVGFKDPSEKQELSGISSWNPDEPFMEYRIGFFDNLKIRVVEVKTKYDGETFIARLRHATP